MRDFLLALLTLFGDLSRFVAVPASWTSLAGSPFHADVLGEAGASGIPSHHGSLVRGVGGAVLRPFLFREIVSKEHLIGIKYFSKTISSSSLSMYVSGELSRPESMTTVYYLSVICNSATCL